MSALPLMIEGTRLQALVVGAGSVGARRVAALLDTGARVRVVAPRITPALLELAGAGAPLELLERPYAPGDIGDAMLVVAATDDRAVNAQVAADARAASRLASVADAPEEGSCAFAATHRAGDLTIGVTTGGVPAAALRVRDAIAARFDARYGAALDALRSLRRAMLAAGERDRWREASAALVPDDFCATVESGAFAERVDAWR